MSSYKWPAEVPVLTPNEICSGGGGSIHDDRLCLMQWANRVFGDRYNTSKMFTDSVWPDVPVKVYNTIAKRCGIELRAITGSYSKTMYVNRDLANMVQMFNDHNTPEKCAQVWNLAMKDLGYTEIHCSA